MTQPTDLPILTPPASSPEMAEAFMLETARVLSEETGVVVGVDGQYFMLGNVPMTIDQVISTLCQTSSRATS